MKKILILFIILSSCTHPTKKEVQLKKQVDSLRVQLDRCEQAVEYYEEKELELLKK